MWSLLMLPLTLLVFVIKLVLFPFMLIAGIIAFSLSPAMLFAFLAECFVWLGVQSLFRKTTPRSEQQRWPNQTSYSERDYRLVTPTPYWDLNPLSPFRRAKARMQGRTPDRPAR